MAAKPTDERSAGMMVQREASSLWNARQGRFASFFQRVREAWFGPGEPQPQIAPIGNEPRQFDYPTGYNLRITPRGDELISFPQLRQLADACDGVRMCIETRKDQIEKFTWSIVSTDPKKDVKADKRVKEITDFFKYPDRVKPWKAWIRCFLEDMLVIDAPSLYLRKTIGGRPYAAELLDGATIRPLIDDTGRRPLDGPAYQQIIKGVVAAEFMEEELLYLPRNPRTNRIYGYSPVEQIIVTINTLLRRDIHVLQYYTEGNVPEALIGVPDTWNVDQIARFQLYWDSVMEGNTAARRHAKFIPGQIASNYTPTREPTLKDELDEWLMRKVCFAFSIPPTAFVKQGMNKATAQIVQDVAIEEGLLPIMEWMKAGFDRMIQEWFGYDDLQFMWQEIKAPDALKKAQTDEILVRLGIKSADTVAEELGLDPPGLPPAIYTASGIILVSDAVKMSALEVDQKANPPMPPGYGPDGSPLAPQPPPERRRKITLADDGTPPNTGGDKGKDKPAESDARKVVAIGRQRRSGKPY